MANYSTDTKIVLVDPQDTAADSVTGSAAKAINDALDAIDASKTIRAFFSMPVSNNRTAVVIVYDK